MMTTIEQAHWLDMRASLEPPVVAPGGNATVVITVDVPQRCHIECHTTPLPFLIPTVLNVRAESITVRAIRYPNCTDRRLDWNPAPLHVYQGTLRFEADIEIDPAAEPGAVTLIVELNYQGCTDTACLPPATRTVEVPVEIQGAVHTDAPRST